MYGHFKYAYVNMDILKMTKHTDDSSIKIRWRISGITGFQMITKMWKFKVWKPTEMLEHRKVWVSVRCISFFSKRYVTVNRFFYRFHLLQLDRWLFDHVRWRRWQDIQTCCRQSDTGSKLRGARKIKNNFPAWCCAENGSDRRPIARNFIGDIKLDE